MSNSQALNLYAGRTVHERRAPFLHRFSYRIASILIDIDRLDDANSKSRYFSVGKFNLFSFFEKDHGRRDGSPLADWARARFSEAGVDASMSRIRLLCAPRVLGYVFNPLSIYFAERADKTISGIIYQVHNTFGDSHAYVAPAASVPIHHQEADKVFHVSPFFDLGGRYEFTLRPPTDRFKLTILKHRENGPDLMANMVMNRKDATSRNFIKLFMSQPFFTLKTIASIHWEALRLVMKGAVYHSRPEPPAPSSLGRLTPASQSRRFGSSHEKE